MSDLREMSRRTWTQTDNSTEQINTGSLQRIADATELMAKRYQDLLDENQRYKGYCNDYQRKILKRDRTISALRGQITKLKNQRLINGD